MKSRVPILLTLAAGFSAMPLSLAAEGSADGNLAEEKTSAHGAALPTPIDIPPGPPSVDPPADRNLPAVSGMAAPDTPAISMISDATLPGETLVITGDRLDGAHLRIWSAGELFEVNPLRTAADRMQALVPKEIPVSTMLIWPVRNEQIGAPIRVNGATAWWSWPTRAAANTPGQSVRIFGKNLKLEGHASQVYLSGPGIGQWLEVVASDPYALEAALPDELSPGAYQAWCHNGTGSQFGWGEAMPFEVVAAPSANGLPIFVVEDFGAKADDDKDDWQAITAAIQAAQDAGGGHVRLSSGTYHLSRSLEIGGVGKAGIHLIGAGMGSHRWHNEPAPDDHRVIHEISGQATVIKPIPGQPGSKYLITLSRRYSSLSKLTLLNYADAGKQSCVWVGAHDVRIEGIRGIVVDQRPKFVGWDKPESEITTAEYKSRLQDGAVMRIDAPGKANIVVRNCEFHHPGGGIDTPPVNGVLGHLPQSGPCPAGTDYIQIRGCTFRGYFDGRLEPVDKARKFQAYRGWGNMAWLNNGSKNVIVERCDFAGADKQGFKVLTRSLNHKNASISDLYLAHNRGQDLAPTSMTPGYHENKGEQFIFHLWYPQAGLFDVVKAGAASVTVDPTAPKYAPTGKHPGIAFKATEFSVVPKDVDVNPEHWIVFVCAGRGVGQYRTLQGCDRGESEVAMRLDKPWRVTPDATSRIVLTAAYRRIIISGNELDGGRNDPVIKSHGVTFWGNAFENIIAGNTFRNMSGGVVINAFYRCPTGWNLTCDNRMTHILGNGGDTVFPGRAAFYVDHVRVLEPPPEDRVWYGVGNIFRGNECSHGDTIAFLHRPDYARLDVENPSLPEATRRMYLMPRGDNTVINYSYPETPDGGLMMSVLENNRFEHVRRGIVISSPLNWLLLRNNGIQSTGDAPTIIDESHLAGKEGARDVLIMEGSK